MDDGAGRPLARAGLRFPAACAAISRSALCTFRLERHVVGLRVEMVEHHHRPANLGCTDVPDEQSPPGVALVDEAVVPVRGPVAAAEVDPTTRLSSDGGSSGSGSIQATSYAFAGSVKSTNAVPDWYEPWTRRFLVGCGTML